MTAPTVQPALAEGLDLVLRHQAGDPDAFAAIYRTHYAMVFRFAYARVKRNRQVAEDIAQTTFARAFVRLGMFEVRESAVGAWLVTIARNLVFDYYKSSYFRLEVTTGDVLGGDREDRSPEGSPESAVIDHITNVHVLAAIKLLTPEQQECIVLRFLKGFSVAEAAQVMGKNEAAVKTLQYRAVRALARHLADEDQRWLAFQGRVL